MITTDDSSHDVPVWARPQAFPKAPAGWGWLDYKGSSHACDSIEALVETMRTDRTSQLNLVWTPDHEWMVLPEEVPALGEALRSARGEWVKDDLAESHDRVRWFGIILGGMLALAFFNGFAKTGGGSDGFPRVQSGLQSIFSSGNVGVAVLMFLIFAFIPWYQARKQQNSLAKWTSAGVAASIPALKMDTWLERQKAPVTKVLLGFILCVTAAQLASQVQASGWASLLAIFHTWGGIPQAGLVKAAYLQGEWWRLFTAPLMHGNAVHLFMNASALLYLGKRLEVFARWPHLVLVFFLSACIGGEASARFVTAPSVGASGGLMGWLGFLLVFETLHKELVPLSSRKRLAAGVLITALIGLVGYRFIDNAAHLGGLLAGMFYALIVFPKSSSGKRPRSTLSDRLAGSAALVVIGMAALLAVYKIASH